MALETARTLAAVERDDNLHVARILMLISAASGRSNKPVDGLTKLAKLDFLLRYPAGLERALKSEGKDAQAVRVDDYERTTIEAKMVRFRYGPWDHRYRRWIAILVGRDLIRVWVKGRTVMVELTQRGREVSNQLVSDDSMQKIAARATIVAKTFSSKSGTALKNFVYSVFPELTSMKWGEEIAP